MFHGEYMAMPLFSAAGVLGGLLRDLAPDKEDIWYFSAFIDLNVYRIVHEAIRRRKTVLERRAIERSAFNLICNAAIVLTEFLRLAISVHFPRRAAYSIEKGWAGSTPAHFIALSVTTLFSISIPIRIWASVRAEEKLEAQHSRLVKRASQRSQTRSIRTSCSTPSIRWRPSSASTRTRRAALSTNSRTFCAACCGRRQLVAASRRDPVYRRLSRY